MGPIEVIKIEIEREEKGEILREFQRIAELSGDIPSKVSFFDKLRKTLEFIGSLVLGLFLGIMSLFTLYLVIRIMH